LDNAGKLSKVLLELWSSVAKIEEAALMQSKGRSLSVSELHTLEAVGEGRRKTMTHVAAVLKISVSTLTAAVNKLVVKGYINRFRIPEDRRMVMLELTEKGALAVREHETFRRTMINDALSQISAEEAEKLICSLENINEIIVMKRISSVADREIKITPDCIYQGGMGIGISMGRLAAAVAICGGVGIISATEPGYREKDYQADPFEANKRALAENIKSAVKAVGEAGGRGLVGVNILCTSGNYEEYVTVALEAGAQVIVSGGGVPTALPGICKGKNVKLVPVVSSARAASVIIRNWAKKHDRTPDALIFEGPLAGGYLGFKEEQLGAAQESFYRNIAKIKAEIESFSECKLIVGGGIHNLQDAQKVIACGADGIQLGSRFVTTFECDAHENFKRAYLDSDESDIGIIINPAGMPGRVLMNSFAKKVQKSPEILKGHVTQALISTANGDTENGLIFCGDKVWKTAKIETDREIFDEFTGCCKNTSDPR